MENKNCKANGGCGCKSEKTTGIKAKSENKTTNCGHKASGGNSQTKTIKSEQTKKNTNGKPTSCK